MNTNENVPRAEFDQYVDDYRDIINRGARITGESFEYFIGVRLALVRAALAADNLLRSGLRVLDFGCGIGATAQQMREHFSEPEIQGLDTSPESVKAAEGLSVPRARFTSYNGGRMPFDDASFDVVYSNGTFHHIPHAEHDLVASELRRVLAPGGQAFIFENNPFNPLMVREMRRNPFDRDAKMVFPHVLRSRLSKAGFRARAPYFYVFFPGALKALRPAEPLLRRVPVGAQYFVRGER